MIPKLPIWVSTFTIVIFVFSRGVVATCYNPTGVADTTLIPCNPNWGEFKPSSCCLAGDYCLSNSLCLNAVGNNLVSSKGCTDKGFASPCVNYCKAVGFEQSIIPCFDTGQSNGSIQYVCGSAADACSTPSKVFSIPVGTVVLRPDQLASITSSLGTTPTASGTKGTQSGTNAANPDAKTSKSNSVALGVGLGVGIPLVLVLIGTVLYFTRELKKYKNMRAGPTYPAYPADTSPSLGYTELNNVAGLKPPSSSDNGYEGIELPGHGQF